MSKKPDPICPQNPPAIEGLGQTMQNFAIYQAAAFPARQPAFFALELAGECGELANVEKKLWRDPGRLELFEHLPHEAADVFISLINYCNSRQIDLEKAVQQKLQEIEKRRQAGLMGKVT